MAKHRKPDEEPPPPASGKQNKHFKGKRPKHSRKDRKIHWPKKDRDEK